MVINGIGGAASVRFGASQAETTKQASTAQATASALQGTSDAATVSVQMLAGESAPLDMAKIAEVKAAIAEGRYPIDPAKIAERMIALDIAPAD